MKVQKKKKKLIIELTITNSVTCKSKTVTMCVFIISFYSNTVAIKGFEIM